MKEQIKLKETPVYGVWNVGGKCWIINDDGRQFQTLNPDVALDVYNNFLSDGAAKEGLLVSIIPHSQIETFTL